MTKEECEHIIRKATETGLALSEVKLPDEETTIDKFASKNYLTQGFFGFCVFKFVCLTCSMTGLLKHFKTHYEFIFVIQSDTQLCALKLKPKQLLTKSQI